MGEFSLDALRNNLNPFTTQQLQSLLQNVFFGEVHFSNAEKIEVYDLVKKYASMRTYDAFYRGLEVNIVFDSKVNTFNRLKAKVIIIKSQKKYS